MKHTLSLFAGIVMAAMLLASCASVETPTPTPTVTITDVASFVTALENQGMTVTTGGDATQPFLSGAGQSLTVNGQEVQVYMYGNTAEATADAQTISADGTSAAGQELSWTSTPHFYQDGPMIVLYVGDDPAILYALRQVLGDQFAGG